jgi:glutaminase
MSRFAGRRLVMDADVYESEAATNDRNRGIAHLLDGYGRMYCDPDLATDVYTRQCSVRVSARDLAVMGATLANGGVNPVTGEQAIETRYCKRVLAVLATAGLYEQSGEWLYVCRVKRGRRGHRNRVAGQGGRRHILPAA